MPPHGWQDHPLEEAPVTNVTPDDVLQTYEDWGSDVRTILSSIAQPTKWNISVVYPPLKSYVHERIIVLGDAVRDPFVLRDPQ